MTTQLTTLLIAVALTAAALCAAILRSLVVAQPDEWLLCIRNGKLVKAGVGIYLWRRPRDVVVRFTSTMQRVSFAIEAISRERLRVSIEGFIFWSVSSDGEGPFRAFQKLGVVNKDAPPRDLKSPKHLLSTPQHRAFQQLLGAKVQRLAGTRSIEDLLLQQDTLVEELRAQLADLDEEMGIHVDQVEILRVRPASDDLFQQMSAEVDERLREEAARIRLAASERGKRLEIESGARLAQEQAEVSGQELLRNKALRLMQIEHDREVKAREQAIARERAIAEEQRASEAAKATLEREEMVFAVELDKIRRRAEASRDAITAVASAEEKKSPPVREHELAKLVTEKVGDALKNLPLREARWLTVSPDSPAGSLYGLVAAARELASGASKKAA